MTDYAYRGRLQGLTAWCNVAALTNWRELGGGSCWKNRKSKGRGSKEDQADMVYVENYTKRKK